MSDADDVAAIQQYLTNAGPQAYAAVAACSPPLDAATRARVDDLAQRVYAFVSTSGPPLSTARALRDEFNAMLRELQSKGCGDVAKFIHDAPAPVQAPPPVGKPGPLQSFLDTLMVDAEGLLVIAALWYFSRRRR